MKKIVLVCLIVIFLAVFCFSGRQLHTILQEYRAGEKTYESIEQYVVIPGAMTPPPPGNSEEGIEPSMPEQTPEAPEILWPEVDFAALREINPDVVGWLYIEGTQINYPIVQGKDNDQYLYRLITGERNGAGSLFLEAGLAPDFSDRNNPVYGHNMKNGSMFAGITGYKNQSFYEEHPLALLLTPERNYRVQIFSAYVLDAGGDAWDTRFTEKQMQAWLEGLMSRSCLETDVVPTTRDSVLTLSTCTYETEDSRFLVHGILVPEDKI